MNKKYKQNPILHFFQFVFNSLNIDFVIAMHYIEKLNDICLTSTVLS